MKKTFLLAALLALCITGGSAFAYNAEGYMNMQRNAKTPAAVIVLLSYEQGLSEAFDAIYAANDSVIPVFGRPYACPPSKDSLNAAGIRAAIAQMVGTYMNPKKTDTNMQKAPIGAVALLGLGALFPCR